MCYMETDTLDVVGVRELRQNLSVYLARVKRGLTYTVTEHGVAVAELRPLVAADDPVARLVAAGAVRAPSRRAADLPPPMSLEGEEALSEVLDDLRRDRV